MAIKIGSIVPSCDTNEHGTLVRTEILKYLASGRSVVLDFHGVRNVTSSFVNTALIELLSKYDVQTIKGLVQIKHANRQIGTMINDRFRSETLRPKELI